MLKGRRVYVTMLDKGGIVLHPSSCTGDRYRMTGKGSVHLKRSTDPEGLGKAVLEMFNNCRT